MPTIPAHDSLFAKCAPAYGLGSNLCGSLTDLDLSPTTSNELASIYTDADGLYRITDAIMDSDWIGKACRIRQNSFYDYIMATARSWDSHKLTITRLKRDLIEVWPFVLMERKAPINNNYWSAANGTATSGTSPNLSAAYTYTVTVTSQTSIPLDVRWFPPRTQIVISGLNAAGLRTVTNWMVVDANISSGVLTLYLISQNAGSAIPSNKRTNPVTGIISLLVPNVNPYESYCPQNPGINSTQMTPFWVQDTRWALCIDEETQKYLQHLRTSNKYFEKWGDIESVELNQQLVSDFQRRMVNTFLYNAPANANQTMAAWRSLPTVAAAAGTAITDWISLPGITGRQIARVAQTPGVYQQLHECGRVKDLAGLPLNIPELVNEIKQMMWLKQDLNMPADVINLVTDSAYAEKLNQGFFRHMVAQWEGVYRVTEDISKYQKTAPNGMTYTEWPLRYPAGVKVRVVTHRAFDDFFSAHAAIGAGSAGRMVLAVDFGPTAYLSILESTVVTNKTGDLATVAAVNGDALCRMKLPRKSVQLRGMKFATVVECPGLSLWMENIADAVPEHRDVGNADSVELAGVVQAKNQPPVFTPAVGDFATSVAITIGTAEPGAAIYYTIDGSTPTVASTAYSGPVTRTATTTFKAIVIKSGNLDSDVVTKTYTKTN